MRRWGAALAVVAVTGCTTDVTEAPATPGGLELTWSTGAQMPTPRTEVAAAALDGQVFVAGGFVADGSATDVVEVYDPSSDAWQDSTPLPEPLHHAGLASASGRLWVVGGYSADGAPSDRVSSWAPGEGSWRSEPPLPTPRGALGVAAVGETIHAVGGATGFGTASELSDAHETLEIGAEDWEVAAPLEVPRDHLTAAGLDGAFYALGGRELSLSRNLGRADVFTDEWQELADLPTPRGGLAAAPVPDEGLIVVFGGEEPRSTFEEVEFYDTGADRWLSGPSMPTPRHGLGAATVDDRIYVVGGGPEPGLTVSGATEILEIAGN